jgi:hypothetical protein
MFKSTRLLIAGVTAFIGLPAFAECDYPQEVVIPNGETATSEDMLGGQTLVKQYMAEMEAYLECLDQEEVTIPENQTPEAKQLHVQRHNAAIDQMETVAAKFNEQIRAYKKVN